jgi:hypothetical protein
MISKETKASTSKDLDKQTELLNYSARKNLYLLVVTVPVTSAS